MALCAAAAACSGFIPDNLKPIAISLAVIGFIGTLWSLISAESQNRAVKDELELVSQLLIKSGAGNLHYERLHRDWRGFLSADQIIDSLLRILKADPKNAQVTSELAVITSLHASAHITVGREIPSELLRLAKSSAERAILLAPDDPAAYCSMGIICDCENRHDEARQWFRKARDRGAPLWQIHICTSFWMEGKFEDALREIEAAISSGTDYGWYVSFWHGICLIGVGRYSDALPKLMLAYRLRGMRPDILHAISEALYFQGEVLPHFYYACLEAFSVLPANTRRGLVLFAQGLMHASIFLTCRFSKLLLPITRKFSRLKNFQYSHFPPFEPESTLARMAGQKGHLTAAETLLDRAIKSTPDVTILWAQKAWGAAGLGRYDDAIAAYDRAIKLEPKSEMLRKSKEQVLQVKAGKIKKPRFLIAQQNSDGTYSNTEIPINRPSKKKR